MKSGLVSADTSFLFSIYSSNEHSARALRFLRRLEQPIVISVINEYEIQTAHRYTEFLGDIGEGQASVFIAQFERDVLDGRITIHEIDLPAVFARAKSLAASYTAAMGARSFDLLHIASALELGAEKFLTFDRIQQKVAMAEGLKSPW